MATVHYIQGKKPSGSGALRTSRKGYGLTLTQAAASLGVPPSVYEAWESGAAGAPDLNHADGLFRAYALEGNDTQNKNFIFGSHPLSMARSIFKMDVKHIAELYGFREATWRKFENHSRVLDKNIIAKIEEDVRESFMMICSAEE